METTKRTIYGVAYVKPGVYAEQTIARVAGKLVIARTGTTYRTAKAAGEAIAARNAA